MKYVAVDAFGGDYAPAEIVKGCVMALNSNEQKAEHKDFGLIITGKEKLIYDELEKCLPQNDFLAAKRLVIQNAEEVVLNEDTPTAAIKQKKDSSMVVGFNLVREGRAEAFVSAGNTGALLAGALAVIGRIKGVQRPALGVPLPGLGGYTFLIDSGANVDAKASYLVQFAQMGSVYVENMFDKTAPKVGLVNIGAEKEKGNALVKEAYPLLENCGVNFAGNVEARDIPLGAVDVAVCDAFVGNIILKNSEGLSKALLTIIKNELMSGFASKIGAVLSKKAFANVKKNFDSSEVGGAPFLGLNGLVVKAHGNSDAKAVKNAIFQAISFIKHDTLNKIKQSIT